MSESARVRRGGVSGEGGAEDNTGVREVEATVGGDEARREVEGQGEGEATRRETADETAARGDEGEAGQGVEGQGEGEAAQRETADETAAKGDEGEAARGVSGISPRRDPGSRSVGTEAVAATSTRRGEKRAKATGPDETTAADAETAVALDGGLGGRSVSGISSAREDGQRLSGGGSIPSIKGISAARGGAKDPAERGSKEYPAL